MPRKIVVVGAGAAGLTAASTIRAQDPDAAINVFTEDQHIAYSPCAVIYAIEGKIKDFDSIIMHDPKFYREERDISVHTRTKVVAVDVEKRTATSADGAVFTWDALVLAVGGRMFVPPIEGTQLPGVYTIKSVDDGKAIQGALRHAEKVVIVGAGVIGLMTAVAVRNLGREVTVLEMLSSVIPRIMDEDMAALVQRHCEGLGIRFVFSTPIEAIRGAGKVESVRAGGKDYPCQMAIMATGVRANLELPKMMDLEIGVLGGIRVSPILQPYRKGRLVKDVYAAGDAIMCQSAVAPGPTMSQLGSSAVRQGRVAGINAAGGYATYPGATSPWVTHLGELQAAGTGLSTGLADYFGIKVVEAKATGLTRARYYPGGKALTVKMIADRETHRIVGAQIVGGEDVTGRINWLTAAVLKAVTVEEFVSSFENAYCPPTSMVKDVVNQAAEALMDKLNGAT
ncbi:MAG: FAD-dependent oxidoreductase, partial [Methanomassiliicoccales archaeon]|nr:FAD-dependent oxidoreductase [Methanomassiliicoccales archaeon]